MDDRRFDDIARHLAGSASRRAVLAALMGLPAGLAAFRRATAACPPGQIDRRGVCLCRATGRPPVEGICPCPKGQTDTGDGLGCVECRSSAECRPSDACVTFTCEAGLCVKTKTVCDDGLGLCSAKACDPLSGCIYTPVICQAAEPRCQSVTCDPATGLCETENFAPGTPCGDGDLCNGEEFCDGFGVCQPGTTVDCSHQSDACHTGVCVPETGGCDRVQHHDGSACATADIASGLCCAGACQECCGDADCVGDPEIHVEAACQFGACAHTCASGYIDCANPNVINESGFPVCRLPYGAACEFEFDCCGGLACSADGVCRLANGQICAADDDCASGFCIDGVCRSGLSGPAGACNLTDGNTDCQSGLLCDDKRGTGECLAPLHGACTGTYYCATGLVCEAVAGGNRCAGYVGYPCSKTSDCATTKGLYCEPDTGACQPLLAPGAACDDSLQCATRNCLTNLNGAEDVCCYLSGNGSCLTDSDCCTPIRPFAQVSCRDGICQDAATAAGAACAKDNDCGTDGSGNDLICCGDPDDADFGTCVTANDCPGPPPPVKKGGFCASTDECDSGLVCIGCSEGGAEWRCLDQDNGCCRNNNVDTYLCGDASKVACCGYECTDITGSGAVSNCGVCGNDCAKLDEQNACFTNGRCDFDGNCVFDGTCPQGTTCQPTVSLAGGLDWLNVTCVTLVIDVDDGLGSEGAKCVTNANCTSGLICTAPCSGPYDFFGCLFESTCTAKS